MTMIPTKEMASISGQEASWLHVPAIGSILHSRHPLQDCKEQRDRAESAGQPHTHLYGIFNEDHSLVYAELLIGCSTCKQRDRAGDGGHSRGEVL